MFESLQLLFKEPINCTYLLDNGLTRTATRTLDISRWPPHAISNISRSYIHWIEVQNGPLSLRFFDQLHWSDTNNPTRIFAEGGTTLVDSIEGNTVVRITQLSASWWQWVPQTVAKGRVWASLSFFFFATWHRGRWIQTTSSAPHRKWRRERRAARDQGNRDLWKGKETLMRSLFLASSIYGIARWESWPCLSSGGEGGGVGGREVKGRKRSLIFCKRDDVRGTNERKHKRKATEGGSLSSIISANHIFFLVVIN